MPSVLIINTGAVLIKPDGGKIRLFYEGVKYSKDEIVPFHIFGSDTSPTLHTTAGSFVTTYMVAKYGNNQASWPAIALKFLLSKDSR